MESTYFFKSNFLIPPSFSIITILHSFFLSMFTVQSPNITDYRYQDWSLSSPQSANDDSATKKDSLRECVRCEVEREKLSY